MKRIPSGRVTPWRSSPTAKSSKSMTTSPGPPVISQAVGTDVDVGEGMGVGQGVTLKVTATQNSVWGEPEPHPSQTQSMRSPITMMSRGIVTFPVKSPFESVENVPKSGPPLLSQCISYGGFWELWVHPDPDIWTTVPGGPVSGETCAVRCRSGRAIT